MGWRVGVGERADCAVEDVAEEDASLLRSALGLVLGVEELYVAVAEWRSTVQCSWSCEESDCRGTHRLDSCMRTINVYVLLVSLESS